MIKKFLIEQAELKSLEAIMNFIFLFLATIATSIAVIYLLFWKQGAESQDLFNSMMGVFAGILGGVLTLAGVAWTIKKADSDRKEEERKKYRPIFCLCKDKVFETIPLPMETLTCDRKFSFDKIDGKAFYMATLSIINSSFSDFYLRGLRINNYDVFLLDSYFITREKTYSFDFHQKSFYFYEDIQKLEIIMEDLLGNRYSANVKYGAKEITVDDLEKTLTVKFLKKEFKPNIKMPKEEKIIYIVPTILDKAIFEG